jgi:uncharacterized protein YraI
MAKKPKKETCIVTAQLLVIRDNPGGVVVKGSPVIDGTELNVYTGSETIFNGYEWLKVDFEEKQCWVMKRFIKPAIKKEEEKNDVSIS